MMTLTACNGLQYRHGPPPVIEGAAVEAASANKLQLLRALAQDASIGGDRASDWYLIAEAGFNFIDDQCRSYFDELFFLERRAERIKTGLAVGAQTTAAILAVTGATTPTMNIVAQAFGFGVHATDLIAGTYLYRLPPATTQGFVVKLQSAYRRGASANRAMIDTPTAAYYAIQRYLDLCLPPRIEAEIAKQIAGTTARAVISDDSIVDLETASRTAPEVVSPRVIAPIVRERIIERSGAPLAKRTPPDDTVKKDLDRVFLTQIQASLCAPRATGTLDADTDRAIRDYLRGRERRVPLTLNLSNATLRTQLQGVVDDVPDCRSAGFASGYEVGKFGPRNGVEQRSEIENLQRRLAQALRNKGSQLQLNVTGQFDEQTRRAIQDIRGTSNQIDQKFNNDLLLIRLRPATQNAPGITQPAGTTPPGGTVPPAGTASPNSTPATPAPAPAGTPAPAAAAPAKK
jgi:hypothetical protein